MEELLETLLVDMVRPFTSASGRVDVTYNSTLFFPGETKNRDGPVSGKITLSYLVSCVARTHIGAIRLAKQVEETINGAYPESVNPLLGPLLVREMSIAGVDADGGHKVILNVNTSVPVVRSIKKC